MTNLKILSLTLCITLTACSHSPDDVAYIPTPNANQIADLMDDDNDGVINARDLCAETPKGAEIDNDGCETISEKSQQKQLKILFANDSDEIPPLFLSQIKEMSDFLRAYPSTTIDLKGYASPEGRAEHNIDLSKRRAANVKKALINYGIAPKRVNYIGYGSTKQQVVSKQDSALERKVIASVVGFKGEVEKEWTIFTTLPKKRIN
ncbi:MULTISPECIES: OmpA family protein [unclassified Vibrio]|uniref:OmpA family protein n=1 Tax=Vibrio sp. HB236076 TaxID=3232307 RepID=A0AB39HIZ2_9VIBR|nr:OmpA family protein [Vibrio sp. HB161653]MDP5254941.1 OmpA family protein [Vibrio sp. HB161653]